MAGKSKILFIGGTGYIGKFIVEASAKAGHDTFVLVTESTLSNPTKAKLIDTFKSFGVTFLYGDLYDHVSLVKAIKQVDVVLSTVGHSLLADQLNIIAAINEAGNVKRFFPSEFGNDVDRLHTVEPAKTTFNTKVQIRRAVEAEGIPFTYVVNFYCADFFLPNLAQPGHVVGPSAGPHRDKVIILGDGNAKGKLNSDLLFFNKGQDFATYTIKAVDDPKTLNKILYIKPPQNIITLNELVSLWEKKTGKNICTRGTTSQQHTRSHVSVEYGIIDLLPCFCEG
ncbi:isoflavone reductase homolog [Solanum stenotomum]|uniref:isoflavone reductase homolog n=1 Tax=Solanum stenotomum TaxID=172797 RepID=UPI0020D0E369|nr:isoflavone reductase homolog [Solanum stenotomum]